MPRTRIRSLLELSLLRIVGSIDCSYTPAVRPNSSINNEVADNEPDSGINLFHQLPTSLLEMIVYKIGFFSGNKEYPVLEYLISPQIRIASFYHYNEKCLFKIFPQFGKLLNLNLGYTEAGDNCLELIGTYCKKLRTLNLLGCRNVTDTGVRLLCFNCDGIGPAAVCETLQHLLIFSTSVTKQGVQMALDNLTILKFLAHETLFEVLLELTKTGLDQNLSKIQIFSFTFLAIQIISPYQKGSLGQVLQFCPSLTSVKIYAVKGLTDADLLSLMYLKNLIRFHVMTPKSKEIKKIKEIEITFEGGVVPILKKFGNSLEVLDISFFYSVDIWAVLKFCPYLTSLSFKRHCDGVMSLPDCELALFRNEKERFILKNLARLYCFYSSPSEILHFLWSFPSLKEIYIFNCDTLTDEFLQNAAKCHKFPNLTKLDLHFCHFVTKEGIDALMTPHNCIEDINIKFCRNVTPANAYDWYLKAKRQNWTFRIYFQNSDIVRCLRTESFSFM